MKPHLYLFISALVILVSACVRDIALDADEKPQVVVECILRNREIQELRLNFTKGTSKKEAEPLTEATATLIDLTESRVAGQFVKADDEDLWTLDYTPVSGNLYRLEVQVPGYDLIYAEDVMPDDVKVLERSVRMGAVPELPGPNIYAWVEWDKINIYKILQDHYLDKTGTQYFLSGSFYYVKDPVTSFIVYAMNYNQESGSHEMAEYLCTDHPYVLPNNKTGGTYVPTCLNENHPKIQLYPNLDGKPLHERYLLFTREGIEREPYFLISGSFTGNWCFYFDQTVRPERLPTDSYLVFASISDNYERYLKDASHLYQIKASTDMSNIYIRENIYTNIIGGVGIFASAREQVVEWDMRWTNMKEMERYWEDYEKADDKSEVSEPNVFIYFWELMKQGLLTWDNI